MAADVGVDLAIGVGGVVVGGLSTWAAVAAKFGAIVAHQKEQKERADRHEEQDDRRFEQMDKKLDRILDAVGGGRTHPRERTE